MYIARQLRETNIAEYLLYMWQTEDLVRANQCRVELLEQNVVNAYQGLSPTQRDELVQWYANLIDMMRAEGVVEKGHLQICRNVLAWLSELHAELMHSPKFPYYHDMYYRALPLVVELRAKGAEKDKPELETAFEALYGVMVLRLRKKEISPATVKAQETIVTWLATLSDYYKENKKGKLEL